MRTSAELLFGVEQAVVLIVRFAEYMGINIDVGKVIDNYLDADEVADWAIEQME